MLGSSWREDEDSLELSYDRPLALGSSWYEEVEDSFNLPYDRPLALGSSWYENDEPTEDWR